MLYDDADQLGLALSGGRGDAPPAPPEPEPAPEAFGEWLLRQEGRADFVGHLMRAARSDPAFPRRGGPDDVRKRMSAVGADGDMFEAVDDAEREWLAG